MVAFETVSPAVAVRAFLVLSKLVFIRIYQCIPAMVAEPYVVIYRVQPFFRVFLRCEVSVVFFFVELSHFVSARFTVARLVAKALQPSSEPSVKEKHEEWEQKAAG